MSKRRTIWIINQYASTPDTGMGGRHYYFANELAKLGYNVTLIAASYGHKMRNPPTVFKKYTIAPEGGFNMVWVRLPRYNGAGSPVRVLNWFRFALDLLSLPNELPSSPDIIFYSSPSLLGYLGAERLARKLKAKLVFEIRDIWPLTLQKVGGYSRKHPLLQLMVFVERRAYRNADVLLSNLEGVDRHIQECGGDIKKFHWIPNGISKDEVGRPQPLSTQTKSSIPENKFIVGYIGAIGKVNAIDCLIEAAAILKNSHPHIAFVLTGSGQLKQHIVDKVNENNLCNVYLINSIPKPQVQSLLSYFDALYLGWLNDDLYRFGIGANKIPEYLYSAKPVIHAYSGACDPIMKSGAGVSVPAEAAESVADAVIRIQRMPKETRQTMGRLGREYALKYYSFDVLARKLSGILFDYKCS